MKNCKGQTNTKIYQKIIFKVKFFNAYTFVFKVRRVVERSYRKYI